MKKIFYIDLPNVENIVNDDIALLENEKAVLESIKNILLTEKGQKIYDPEFGTSLSRFLFKHLPTHGSNINTTIDLHNEIFDSLTKFEPRISNLKVEVKIDDANQTFIVGVFCNIISSNKIIEYSFDLNKIR